MLPLDVQALLSRHAHLVTHRELLAAGVAHDELSRWVGSGSLVRVRRGVYVAGEYWEGLEEGPARWLVRARAASRLVESDHVLSHDSAAHALGLAFLKPRRPLVHVTRERVLGSRTTAGVKHHGAPYASRQVVRPHGLAVLDVARTAVDLAREHGFEVGLGACDSALRLGTTPAELRRAVEPMASWPGVRSARRAVLHADPGAENPGESLARVVALSTGMGVVETQVPFQLPQQVAWCDLLIGAHVVEFDGRVKYRRPEFGGVASRDPGEVVWRERERERELLRLGLGVSRLVWDDLLPHRVARTRLRLAAEIGETFARGGHALPAPLAEYAVSMADARSRRLLSRSAS